MQLITTVTLVFCLSTAFAYRNLNENVEATTNEIDNSVGGHESESNNLYNGDRTSGYGARTYGDSGSYVDNNEVSQSQDVISSSPAPVLTDPEVPPMPTTGCFGHLPQENNINNVDKINPEQTPLSDPIPPQFNHHGHMSRPIYRPAYYPTGEQQYPFSQQQFDPSGAQQWYPSGAGPQQWNPHYPHHHQFHPHPHNPWSPWSRNNMPFVAPPQFNPQNNWSPWRRQMPFVAPPMAQQFFPENRGKPPIVIVKLLQPIILPVAKPMFPEIGERDPESEDVYSQKYMNGGNGFQKYMNGGFHRFGPRRLGAERVKMFDRPMPIRENGQNTFGPYRINGANGENIHISVKLH